MIFFSILFLFTVLWVFQTQLYRLKGRQEFPEAIRTKLTSLGKEAIENLDIPVAAVLVYKGEVIGEGFNSVKRDGNLLAHAEVNAVNDAFQKMGESFFQMDRSQLILYSSFEPCKMCKSVLDNHNVKQIRFEEAKPMMEQLKNTVKDIRYEWNKQQLKESGVQKELWEAHPSYREHHGL